MNLQNIAAGVVSAVNRPTPALLLRSAGYTVGPDGAQQPTYDAPIPILCQVQELTQRDIMHLSGLNLQGAQKAVYLNGRWTGAVRVKGKGGDLLKFDNQTWLVTAVIEQYRDWTKLGVTLQDGS